MDEVSAWRELAGRFTELGRADGNQLYACWSSSPFNNRGEHWFMAGSSLPSIIDSFKWAAERAAVLLGLPAGSSALFYWLNLLKDNSPRYQGGGSSETHSDDGTVTRAEVGTIRCVCLASEEYCFKLETEAIARQKLAFAKPMVLAEARQPATAESIAAQLTRLREECRWTIDELAEKIQVNLRTAQRHLASDNIPHKRHIAAYERVFSKELKRQIVIEKMP
jgi:hypothetical protein